MFKPGWVLPNCIIEVLFYRICPKGRWVSLRDDFRLKIENTPLRLTRLEVLFELTVVKIVVLEEKATKLATVITKLWKQLTAIKP